MDAGSRSKIAADQLETYRATARRRRTQDQQARLDRRAQAWIVARQAAELLRQRFAATRVLVFGSLAHDLWFTATSDIDLAADGIGMDDFFTAVAHLQDISPQFRIDLVDLARCPVTLREAILQEGREL